MKNTTKLLNSYIASLLVWNVKLESLIRCPRPEGPTSLPFWSGT